MSASPSIAPLRWLLILLAASVIVTTQAGGVTYAGGDGTSLEKAIVIKGATESTGVAAEYEYLKKHFPGYKMSQQSLIQKEGKAYDVLDFTTADGKKMTVFFDISDFFGKF